MKKNIKSIITSILKILQNNMYNLVILFLNKTELSKLSLDILAL